MGPRLRPQWSSFYSTNVGGHVLLHGVQGAYYWKSFGKHGNLHNPYAYGYFDHAPHQNFKGGHVTVGGIVYQGDAYPPEFRGKYIAADLLGHAVYWHDLLPDGSTFRTRHGGDLLLANDTWFAPSDVALGPDGCVYVADWHDQRMAHPDPDAEWDRRNGRVFRIVHGDAKPQAAFDLGKLSSAELLKLLDHPNGWHARTARRILAARRDPEVILPLRTRVLESKDQQVALNALWALYVSGGFDEAFGCKLLDHAAPMVRYWAVRLLGDEENTSEKTALQLMMLATTEVNLSVCSQLACTALRVRGSRLMPVLMELIKRTGIERDPHLPLLLWWGIENHMNEFTESLYRHVSNSRVWSSPILRFVVVPRLLRRLISSGSDANMKRALDLWNAGTVQDRSIQLPAIELGFSERPKSSPLSQDTRELWIKAHRTHVSIAGFELSAIKVLMTFDDDNAILEVAGRLRYARLSDKDRVELIRAVGAVNSFSFPLWVILEFIEPNVPMAVQLAAVETATHFDELRIAAHFLNEYSNLKPEVRAKIRAAMLARPSWADLLFQAVEQKHFPAKDFTLDELRPLAATADEKTKALIRKHWGALPVTTPEEKLAEVRRLNNDLRAGAGDAKAGRALYKQHCAACHTLFGDGAKVGPDLTTANRFDRDNLLVSIVDPNAVVRREYMTHVVQTKDGRSLTGVIVEQSPAGVTLFTAAKERVTVRQAQIEEMNPTDVSLMPENLLKALKPQELRDLFAFLQAKTAPPR